MTTQGDLAYAAIRLFWTTFPTWLAVGEVNILRRELTTNEAQQQSLQQRISRLLLAAVAPLAAGVYQGFFSPMHSTSNRCVNYAIGAVCTLYGIQRFRTWSREDYRYMPALFYTAAGVFNIAFAVMSAHDPTIEQPPQPPYLIR